jgi:hypothetical protein
MTKEVNKPAQANRVGATAEAGMIQFGIITAKAARMSTMVKISLLASQSFCGAIFI